MGAELVSLLLQGEGFRWDAGTVTLALNGALLLLNAGIAWGSRRAHERSRERTLKQIDERVNELEDDGSPRTQEKMKQLRRDVDRIDAYLTPVLQERLKRGDVVKFGSRGGADDDEAGGAS